MNESQMQETINKLQKALMDLIGAKNKNELKEMELFLRNIQAPESDKIAAINAIHVLLEIDSES